MHIAVSFTLLPQSSQRLSEADHKGGAPRRGIGQAQFDRVAQLLAESLRDAGVPPELVGQILTAIAPLAGDIVSPPAAPQV
jgi:truncated hemoglobin YjbI